MRGQGMKGTVVHDGCETHKESIKKLRRGRKGKEGNEKRKENGLPEPQSQCCHMESGLLGAD